MEEAMLKLSARKEHAGDGIQQNSSMQTPIFRDPTLPGPIMYDYCIELGLSITILSVCDNCDVLSKPSDTPHMFQVSWHPAMTSEVTKRRPPEWSADDLLAHAYNNQHW